MFYDTFSQLCKEISTTPSRAAQDMGINKSTVTYWKTKEVVPNGATLNKIADYFGVTLDYLLGNEQKEAPAAKSDEVTFDDFTYALHNQSKELNDANKEKLLDMARMLKLAQDAQKNK